MRMPSPASIRCDVPVLYATTDGQTRRIAERLVSALWAHELTSDAFEVASQEAAAIDWTRVRGVVVGASVHIQRHQPRAHWFVAEHLEELRRVPSAFFSVSLRAASWNDDERAAARRIAEAFADHEGWKPSMVATFAGRLAYTQYGFFTRRLVRRMARKEGVPADMTRDYELTNWTKVDRLALALAAVIHEHARRSQIGAA